MTPKELFIKALKREPIVGRVPTFELVFFLTMESIGRVHPLHRDYSQWFQMSLNERKLQLEDMARCYIDIAEKYHHSAIFVHPNPGVNGDITNDFEVARQQLEVIREMSGDKYFLMLHGDPTIPIPTGDTMMDYAVQLYEDPGAVHEKSKRRLDSAMELCDQMKRRKGLLDGFCLCSDYCFNANPFYSREMFEEFIVPYLKASIDYYRENGFFSIKHTDGNVMPILDMIVDCHPDAVHSLDPQGGVDLKEVKRLYGDKVALCGNVNCGLMQTGTIEELEADTRRALRDGMPGYGFIFCTSNCAYTGLELDRYERMNRIWYEEGIYK